MKVSFSASFYDTMADSISYISLCVWMQLEKWSTLQGCQIVSGAKYKCKFCNNQKCIDQQISFKIRKQSYIFYIDLLKGPNLS